MRERGAFGEKFPFSVIFCTLSRRPLPHRCPPRSVPHVATLLSPPPRFSAPQELQKCFDAKDVQMLQDTISRMDPTVSVPSNAHPTTTLCPPFHNSPPFLVAAGGEVPHAALHRFGAVGPQRQSGS